MTETKPQANAQNQENRTAHAELTNPSRRSSARHFVLHYVEMVIAMMVGMMVLGPLARMTLTPLGFYDRADLSSLVMATEMAIGMTVWMRVRGHGWPTTLEMAAAMFVPFVVLFVPLWLGAISGTALMIAGNVLMFPAMTAVMLRRRDEYTRHHPLRLPWRK